MYPAMKRMNCVEDWEDWVAWEWVFLSSDVAR